jgi:hypothetical protein
LEAEMGVQRLKEDRRFDTEAEVNDAFLHMERRMLEDMLRSSSSRSPLLAYDLNNYLSGPSGLRLKQLPLSGPSGLRLKQLRLPHLLAYDSNNYPFPDLLAYD